MMDISIVGAGPAGTYTGELLSKLGHKVNVYEEHSKIGEPLACTGILTRQIENFVDTRKILVNRVDSARIIAAGKEVRVKLGGGNLVIDRVGLDRKLAQSCERAGAKIHTRCRFETNTGRSVTIRDISKGKKITKESDLIIGADGPSSAVAKSNSLYNNRRWWIGMQAKTDYPNNGEVEFYPTVGTYAWVVPENKDEARIGVCARDSVKPIFDKFLSQLKIKKIHSRQAGLIPEYDPQVITKKGIVRLVGDAATQIKATTGGGIIQALTAGQALSDSVEKNTDYDKEWRSRLSRDLWIHLKMRQAMDRFKEKDWEHLLTLFEQDKIRSILEDQDREQPSKFILKMALMEPRLITFFRFLF